MISDLILVLIVFYYILIFCILATYNMVYKLILCTPKYVITIVPHVLIFMNERGQLGAGT